MPHAFDWFLLGLHALLTVAASVDTWRIREDVPRAGGPTRWGVTLLLAGLLLSDLLVLPAGLIPPRLIRIGAVGRAALELRMWAFGMVLLAIPFTALGALAAGIAAAVREARGTGGGGPSFAAWVFGAALLFAHLVLWAIFGAIPLG